jgi:hypothetical protein
MMMWKREVSRVLVEFLAVSVPREKCVRWIAM